jgi:hypothetical protein
MAEFFTVPEIVRVHLACNDPDSGAFAGETEMVEFQSDRHEATLGGEIADVAFEAGDRAVVIAGERYAIQCHSHWVGNWCWDAVTMSFEDARRLLTNLLKVGFKPEEWTDEGPFSGLLNEAAKGHSEVRVG